jgi:alkylated DNA repair protein (DNA oxidative demethylase)
MMQDLFDIDNGDQPPREQLAADAVLLRGRALPVERAVLNALREIVATAPFRHMITPGGFKMSVAMTNCGAVGWVTDRTGYRYDPLDPVSGLQWPAMPDVFRNLATEAASEAGFDGFVPDSCLINRYESGARLSPHQDRNERDYSNPIVSVSLGLPATFQFGGAKRNDKFLRVRLRHGDIVVWGGASRLVYHGVLPLNDGEYPAVGRARINLTFRKAL